MSLNAESFGTQIRNERLRKEITLRELARRLKISPAFQTLIETDRSSPDAGLIARIAKELDLDADGLCGLAGKISRETTEKLARVARQDPKFFRTMVNRMGGT
jgi:transcriptional regulator with XRE-family HTH domain